MGKKKSKASKQKQAKAKSMTNRRKQGAKFNTPMSVGGEIAKDAQPKRNLHANRKKKLRVGKPNVDVKKKQPQKRDADFEREFRALEERQYHAGISGKSKSKTIEFSQPTLQLDKKPILHNLLQMPPHTLEDYRSSVDRIWHQCTAQIQICYKS